MASWTTPVIHATGDVLAVTDWNGVANNTTFLYQAPYMRAFSSSSTPIPTSSLTRMTLGSTSYSGYGFSVTGDRISAPLAGVYCVSGAVRILGQSSASVGTMNAQIAQQGTVLAIGSLGKLDPTDGGGSSVVTTVFAAVNDLIEIDCFQDSGGQQNSASGTANTYISAFFIGSQ